MKHIYKKLYKRYIDDGFMLWAGSEQQLLDFIDFLNQLHKTIKFQASYDFQTREVTFLDVTVRITEGRIITDLYRKPTAAVQYLLPSSCHPPHVTGNIPFSLCYRLLRICSERPTLILRLQELKEMLLTRHYDRSTIDTAILQ